MARLNEKRPLVKCYNLQGIAFATFHKIVHFAQKLLAFATEKGYDETIEVWKRFQTRRAADPARIEKEEQ